MVSKTDNGLRLTLYVLLLVYILNFLDRQIIGILAQPISQDLGLSDTQLGLMTGLAFAIFYTGLGIPIARFADRPKTDRVTLVTVCLAVWSGMTVLCGATGNFWQLFLARMGVGIGEAGGTPPVHSLISELAPPEQRASALALYQLGPPIGGLIGLVLGGYLADTLGWRWAFVIVGAPGILLALVVRMLLRDPRRLPDYAAPAEAAQTGFVKAFRSILATRAIRLILLAQCFAAVANFTILVWGPTFFQRSHGLTVSQTGLWFGLANGIGSALGVWFGGKLGDRMRQAGKQHLLTAPALSIALAGPLLFAGLMIGDWHASMWLMFPAIGLLWLQVAPTYSAVQGLVPTTSRATASATILLIQNLFGLGLAVPLVGWLSDRYKPEYGADSVQVVLAPVSLGVTLVAGALLWRARRYLPEELDRWS
jgi:MFS transporter, Spinster family, sphingosine-1-phosphate transporter